MSYEIFMYIGDTNKFRQRYNSCFAAFEAMHELYMDCSNKGAVLLSSKRTQMGYTYEMSLNNEEVTINLYIND
jgi:hypothetical protein